MKLPFLSSAAPKKKKLDLPDPVHIPELPHLQIAARYRGARVGGDFYDFEQAGNRLVFLMLDIAGNREEALHIAAAVQDTFRLQAARELAGSDINVAEKLTDLLLATNRTLMATAGGVRCAPAFLGCLEPEFGTLCYCNAGHVPGLLKDSTGVHRLDANGFPLGLFSHTTHDAQLTVLEPGARLVLVSKGLIESRAGLQEFTLDRAEHILKTGQLRDADEICFGMLEAVKQFQQKTSTLVNAVASITSPEQNDVTAVAIARV